MIRRAGSRRRGLPVSRHRLRLLQQPYSATATTSRSNRRGIRAIPRELHSADSINLMSVFLTGAAGFPVPWLLLAQHCSAFPVRAHLGINAEECCGEGSLSSRA